MPTRRFGNRHRWLAASSIAMATAMLHPAAAQAQSTTNGVGVRAQAQYTTGAVTYTPGTPTPAGTATDVVRVNTAETLINWVPYDTATGGGPITFLPAGNGLFYISDAGNYTVVNRILPTDATRAVRFDGQVAAFVNNGGAIGGNIFFFSPGGIIVGSTGRFDVGSLVLTTSDITQTVSTSTTLAFAPASQAGSKITIEPWAATAAGDMSAQLQTFGANSYLALVAPTVEMFGRVDAPGNVAYVAAESATMTISGSLFDIVVNTGTTSTTGIEHTGTTTGSAYGGPSRRIQMVAVPKNDVLTMLVSGAVGYQAASSAGIVGGNIVLTAGAPGGPDANIDIREANFIRPVTATASNDIRISADGAGDAVVVDDGMNAYDFAATAGGNISVELTNGAGLNVSGDLSLRAGSGDTGGDITIKADAAGIAAPTAANGVQVSGNLTLDTSATGASDTAPGGVATDAAAGDISIALTQGAQFSVGGNLTVDAFAQAGFGDLRSGDATGGTVTIAASGAGGAFAVGGDTEIDAGARAAFSLVDGGPSAGETGGDATGGDVSLAFDGIDTTFGGALQVDTSARASSGRNAAIAQDNAARAGDIALSFTGGTHDLFFLDFDAVGTAGLSFDGAGNGLAGSVGRARVDIALDGATVTTADDNTIDASTSGDISASAPADAITLTAINGSSFTSGYFEAQATHDNANSTNQGTAGGIAVTAANSALALGSLTLRTNAFVSSSTGGNKSGGSITVTASNGSLITASDARLLSDAVGPSANTGGAISLIAVDSDILFTGGTQIDASAELSGGGGSLADFTGGAVTIRQTGADSDLTFNNLSLSAAATLSDGVTDAFVGNGANAAGGTVTVDVQGGNFTADSLSIATFATGQTGGSQVAAAGDFAGNGGSARSGDILITAAGTSFDPGIVFLQNTATGGTGGTGLASSGAGGAGAGGAAEGGAVVFDLLAGTVNLEALAIILPPVEVIGPFLPPSIPTFDVGSTAVGGTGGFGDGAPGGAGGSATGGTAIFNIAGADVTVSTAAVSVFSGAYGGAGGNSQFNSDTGSYGGPAGAGGSATGGTATYLFTGGTSNVTAAGADASAFGGIGGDHVGFSGGPLSAGGMGGSAHGGMATITLGADETSSALYTVTAQATGGDGGDGLYAGAGGNAEGGTAQFNVDNANVNAYSVGIDASAYGGNGGYPDRTGAAGGAGGNATGGTAGIDVFGLAGVLTTDQGIDITSTGTGGDGVQGAYLGDGGAGGFGRGGSIVVTSRDGASLELLASSTIDASGLGGAGGDAGSYDGNPPGAGGAGGAGYGGSIEVSASNATLTASSVEGPVLFNATGSGGAGGSSGYAGYYGYYGGQGTPGGNGISAGGAVNLGAFDSGTFQVNGDLEADASGVGRRDTRLGSTGSDATGGAVTLDIDTGGAFVVTGNATLEASARATLGRETIGNATGGTVDLTMDGAASLLDIGGSLGADVSATDDRAFGFFDGQPSGGDTEAGEITFDFLEGRASIASTLELFAMAGIETSEGSVLGGSATAGDISLLNDGAADLTFADVTIDASARGAVGNRPTGGEPGERGGDAFGGNVTVSNAGTGSLTATSIAIDAGAQGGYGGRGTEGSYGAGGAGGNAVGGTVLVANGSTLSVQDLTVVADAIGGRGGAVAGTADPSGAGGIGRGGDITLSIAQSLTGLSDLTLSATGTGGSGTGGYSPYGNDGSDGGEGLGGSILLELTGAGTVFTDSTDFGLSLDVTGQGGTGGYGSYGYNRSGNGGRGGNGTGGNLTIASRGGAELSFTGVLNSVSASGIGGAGGTGAYGAEQGGSGGYGGFGLGGSIELVSQDQSLLDLTGLTGGVHADGRGGAGGSGGAVSGETYGGGAGGTAGGGQGGSLLLFADSGTITGEDIDLTASGRGGAGGIGGSSGGVEGLGAGGAGGQVEMFLNGPVTLGAVTIDASGYAGNEDPTLTTSSGFIGISVGADGSFDSLVANALGNRASIRPSFQLILGGAVLDVAGDVMVNVVDNIHLSGSDNGELAVGGDATLITQRDVLLFPLADPLARASINATGDILVVAGRSFDSGSGWTLTSDSDISITANEIVFDTLRAFGGVTLNALTGGIGFAGTGTITAGTFIDLDAAQAIAIGDADAETGFTINAGDDVAFGTITNSNNDLSVVAGGSINGVSAINDAPVGSGGLSRTILTAGGDIALTGTAQSVKDGVFLSAPGNIAAATIDAGINAQAFANGTVTVGTVNSGTGALLQGTSVTLDNGSVGGNLMVTATSGSIAGNGTITVGGTADFDAPASISFGSLTAGAGFTANTGGDIAFDFAGTTGGDLAFAAGGSVLGGDLDVAGLLSLTGALIAIGNASGTTLALGSASDILFDSLTSPNAISLTAANGTIGANAGPGDIDSGGDVSLNARVVSLGNVTSGGSVNSVASAGDANFGTIDAAADITVTATGTPSIANAISGGNTTITGASVTLNNGAVGGNLRLNATAGDIDGSGAITVGGGIDFDATGDIAFGTLAAQGGAFTVDAGGAIAFTGATGSDAIAMNAGGAILGGDLDAGGALGLSGASVAIGDASAASIGISSGSDIRFDSLSSPASVILSATNGAIGANSGPGDIDSGGGVSLVAQDIALGDVTAAGGVGALASTGDASFATIDAGGDVTITAAGTPTVANVISGGDTSITGSTIAFNNGTVGGALRLNATAGDIDGTGVVTVGGAIDFDATGNIAFGSLGAGGDFTVDAGGAIDFVGASTTQGVVAMNAGGAITGGNVSSAVTVVSDDVTFAAGGGLSLGNVFAGDGLSLTGATVTAGDLTASNGSVSVASPGAANLGFLSATGGIGVTAASIGLTGAGAGAGLLRLAATAGDLVATGDMTTSGPADLDSDGALAMEGLSAGGAISLDSGGAMSFTGVTSTGGAIAISSGANVAGTSVTTSANASVDDRITIAAAGTITIGVVDSGDSIDVTGAAAVIGQLLAGTGISVDTGGVASFGFARSGADTSIEGGSVRLTSGTIGGALTLSAAAGDLNATGTINAGGAIDLGATGNISFGSLAANGGGFAVDAGGAIGFGSASAAADLTMTAGGAIEGGDLSAADGTLTLDGGLIAIGNASANAIAFTSASDILFEFLSSPGAIILTASSGTIGAEAGDIDSGGGVSLVAGQIAVGDVVAAGSVGALAGSGDATFASIDSGGDITLRANNGFVGIGQATAAGDLAVDSLTGFAAGPAPATIGGDALITTAGAADLGSLSVGGLIDVTANHIDFASLTAGETVDLETVQSAAVPGDGDIVGGELTAGAGASGVRAFGSIAVTGATNVAGSLAATAAGNITLGNVSAGTGLAATAGGDIAFTDLLTADNNLVLEAGGDIAGRSARNAAPAGSGGDDSVSLTAGGNVSLSGVSRSENGFTVRGADIAIAGIDAVTSGVGSLDVQGSGAVDVGFANTGNGASALIRGANVTLGNGDIGANLALDATAGDLAATGVIDVLGAADFDAAGNIGFGNLAAGTGFTAHAGGNIVFTLASTDDNNLTFVAVGNITGASASNLATVGSGGDDSVSLTAGGSVSLSGTSRAENSYTVRGGSIAVGVLDAATSGVGALDLRAGGPVQAGTISTAGSASALIEGSEIGLSGGSIGGNLTLNATDGSIAIDPAGLLEIGGAAHFEATADIAFGSITAGTGFTADAGGDLTFADAATADNNLTFVAGGDIAGNSASNLAAAGSGGDDSVSLTADGSVTLTGTSQAEQDFGIDAGGAITGGSFVAGGRLSLDGASIAIQSGTAATIDFASSGDILFDLLTSANPITLVAVDGLIGANGGSGDIASGGNVTLTAQGIAMGNVASGGSVAANATRGDASFGIVEATEAIAISAAGTPSLVRAVSGGNTTLTGRSVTLSNGSVGGNLSLTATDGDIDANGSVTVGGGITFDASGNVAFGTLAAQGGDFTIDVGGAIDFATATAGGDLGFTAEGTIAGDNLTAVGSIRLRGASTAVGDLVADGATIVTTGDVSLGNTVLRGGDFALQSGADVAMGDVTGAQAIDIAAGRALALGSLDASDGIAVLAQDSISGRAVSAGGNVSAIAQGGNLALSSLEAGGDATLRAGGNLAAETLAANGALTGSAGGTLSAQSTVAADALDLSAGSTLTLGDAIGGTVALRSNGGAVIVTHDIESTFSGDGQSATVSGAAVQIDDVNTVNLTSVQATDGDIDIVAVGDVGIVRAESVGDINVASTGGDVLFGLAEAGMIASPTSASGAISPAGTVVGGPGAGDITIDAAGRAQGSFVAAGSIDIAAGGDIVLDLADAAGAIDLVSGGRLNIFGGVIAGVDIFAQSEGDMRLVSSESALEAGNTLTAVSGGTFDVQGRVVGRAINLAVSDLEIGTEATVGDSTLTRSIRIDNRDRSVVLGGDDAVDGTLTITNAEFARIHSGGDLGIFANSGEASQAMTVRDLSVSANSAGNLGAEHTLTLGAGETLDILGNLEIAGTGDTALRLIGPSIVLDTAAGNLRVENASGTATGRIEILADSFIAASEAARTAIEGLAAPAIEARLAQNDGDVREDGYIQAGALEVRVEDAFLVQNSGMGDGFDQRRGLAVGSLSIDGVEATNAIVVVNGTVGGATGVEALAATDLAGSFAAGSAINGCVIANPASCVVAPPPPEIEFDFFDPARDVIEEEIEPGFDGEALEGDLDSQLIEISQPEELQDDPLIDDPVTGAGNEDFWVGEPECEPGAEDQATCPTSRQGAPAEETEPAE